MKSIKSFYRSTTAIFYTCMVHECPVVELKAVLQVVFELRCGNWVVEYQ
jgi:hypothetical protein